jgi:lipooligosaccharide transport system permease protein
VTVASPTRVLPLAALWRGPSRLLERNAIVYRTQWYVIASGFFEPVFYLLSIGLGLGRVVGTMPYAGADVRFAAFVAPALLATSAMNGALYDATGNVYFKLRYTKLYDTVLTAPRTLADVAVGETAWATMRGTLYTTSFVVVMAVAGVAESWWLLAAVPASVLMSAAFAAAGMVGTTFLRGWSDLELVQLVQLPLFLFSATFFPIGTYPRALQLVVQCLPTYHGVDLVRSLALGHVHVGLLGHVAYLATMLAVGIVVLRRRLGRLLLH